jgi:hypothetical protein
MKRLLCFLGHHLSAVREGFLDSILLSLAIPAIIFRDMIRLAKSFVKN